MTDWQSELCDAVSAGVTVLFTPVTQATIEIVRQITRRDELALTEPFFGETAYCIKAPISWARVNTPEILTNYYDGILVPYPFEPNASPLISGLANIDLNWGGAQMFSQGIELAGMDPVAASPDYSILISNWHINSEPGKSIFGEMLNGVRDLRQNTWFVNRDPVVFQIPSGAGSFVFNQLQLDAAPIPAARVMTLLLSQLGAPFRGTPVPNALYDLTPQAEQLARFADFAGQTQPGRRQHYGVPKPMPPFLKETRIGQEQAEELPLLGFVGDELSLQLAHAVGESLSDILRSSQPVRISQMDDAVSQLQAQAASAEWDRLVLSVGNRENLSPERFAESLRQLYQAVRPKAQQLFWLPLAPAPDPSRQSLIEACNQAAEEVFAGQEIYMTPFVYDNAEQVLRDFLRTGGRGFTGDEVKALAASLSEAVRSFGAM